MTAVQERLDFNAPATRGASRRSDPRTSVDAGRSLEGQPLRDQQALVLGAVVQMGDATAFELWEHLYARFIAGYPRSPKENVIARRLTELRELGMVRLTGETRPGSSHRKQQVWAVTEAGRQATA